MNQTKTSKHKWAFAPRFRRQAFGWRSQTAIDRLKEAVTEIKAMARQDKMLAADGVVVLLEKLSPALEQIDSSSGAIGTAVNNAIEALVPIFAASPADNTVRMAWLERLWKAVEEDGIPYIESLPDHWGALCRTKKLAEKWADRFIDQVRITWADDRNQNFSPYFKGTPACLSCLFTAGRYVELLELLALAPFKSWGERIWGVKALAAMGNKEEALRYAEDSRDQYANPIAIAQTCEVLLLESGLAAEAYDRYAIQANQKTTYVATFKAIAKKYPQKNPAAILADLVASSPGNEGKWFAAAKSAGLYMQAIELANRTPCDPRTLTRAARDMHSSEPRFALEAGMAALRWMNAGYGYEITGQDVREAGSMTLQAARNAGCEEEVMTRIRALLKNDRSGQQLVSKILGPELG